MIRRAEIKDLDKINRLLFDAELAHLPEDGLKDPCLVGEVNGEVVGFIWASVGESRLLAYVDHLVVDPAHKGMGARLALAGFTQLQRLGVKQIISMVDDRQDRNEALELNRRLGMLVKRVFMCAGNLKESLNG